MVKDADGLPTQSPYLAVDKKAMEQVRVMMVELGMSPSSRSRVARGPHGAGGRDRVRAALQARL